MENVCKNELFQQGIFGLTKNKKRAIIIKLSDESESERTAETAEYWEKRDFKILIKLFFREILKK